MKSESGGSEDVSKLCNSSEEEDEESEVEDEDREEEDHVRRFFVSLSFVGSELSLP